MDKVHILSEIKRIARNNGGVPPGKGQFYSETGIKESDWLGRYWARWSDAVLEADLTPRQLNAAFDDAFLLEKLAQLATELAHLPTKGEMTLKRRIDRSFPSANVYARWATKAELVANLASFCRTNGGFDDVLALCEAYVPKKPPEEPSTDTDCAEQPGHVYLIKSGRYYKIGRSVSADRREREIALQLPEKAERIHVITSDDAVGIEAYWHKRFEAKRKNGEWFELSAADIKAFKRRKFM